MKAVVLAGGVRSGTEIPGSGLPRALWPFPHAALIEQVLHFLRNQNIHDIAVCANGKTRMIEAHLSAADPLCATLHYSEDIRPRGPAGCLRDLCPWLGDEPFVAIQAAASYNFDLSSMIDHHHRGGAAVTVGARTCNDDADALEPAGVYIIDPDTLENIAPVGYQDFKEQFLPRVIARGAPVKCHRLRGTAALIHSPAHYLHALGDAIILAARNLPAGYSEISGSAAPPIVAHHTANISPTARITGPAWIDAGARVEAGAVIAGPALLAPGATLGAHALMHHAAALAGSRIAPRCTLSSAILGPGEARHPFPHPSPAAFRSSRGLPRLANALSRWTAAM